MRLAQSDLRSIAVFRSVVEHESFVGAQIALGLSQSAVSFHIKALEDRLGFRLCRRGRAGFELTDRGRVVHQRSNALFVALNAFESDVSVLRNRVVGTLRLGLIDNTLTDPEMPIPHVLDRICRLAPEARVDIRIDSPMALATDLARADLDIAILPDTKPVEGLTFSPFRSERHLLHCGAAHPLFSSPESELTLERVGGHSFVVRPYANLQELRHFPKAQVGASASNMEAQAMFILSGHYLGYLPAHYAAALVREGRMRAILPDLTAIASPFAIVTRRGERPSTLLDLFVRELIGAISQLAHGAPTAPNRRGMKAPAPGAGP